MRSLSQPNLVNVRVGVKLEWEFQSRFFLLLSRKNVTSKKRSIFLRQSFIKAADGIENLHSPYSGQLMIYVINKNVNEYCKATN